jgi:hypothetical protein
MLAAMTKSADITNEVILKCQEDSYYFGCYSRTAIESHRHYYFWRRNSRRLIMLEVMDEIYNRNNFQELFPAIRKRCMNPRNKFNVILCNAIKIFTTIGAKRSR